MIAGSALGDHSADGGDGRRSTDQWSERHDASSIFGHYGKGVCLRRRRALLDLWNLAGWTLLERGLRIAVVGLAVWLLSYLFDRPLRRLYGVYLMVVGIVFTTSIWAIITAWS